MQVTGQEAWQNLGRDEVEWQDVALNSGRRWMLFMRPYTKKNQESEGSWDSAT